MTYEEGLFITAIISTIVINIFGIIGIIFGWSESAYDDYR